MKRKIFLFLLILFAIMFVYITNIYAIPQNIIIFENENYEINLLKGVSVEGENISTKSNVFKKVAKIGSKIIGDAQIKFSTFGGIASKEVTVSVIPKVLVIPCGDIIGVQVYSKGVLVIGTSKIEGENGDEYMPYESTNIKLNDSITKINGIAIENIEELKNEVNKSEGLPIKIAYTRNGETYEEIITPVKSFDSEEYKLGIWVRDGTMGIGTLTFYEPEEKYFGALGHPVSDQDTKQILDIEKGYLNEASVLSVVKGQKADPGEIRGALLNIGEIGNIILNTPVGIYGKIINDTNLCKESEAIPVASRYEVKQEAATIKCTLDENGVQEYNVEIERINNSDSSSTKGMIVKVTDEKLLEKTGGIIQGMSGSPIIQDGKFIGAVTHVFVNDPTRGYAIFADTMIKQVREIE